MILKDGQRHYSVTEAAQLCGLRRFTFANRINRGTIAKPATSIGQRQYYSEEQLNEVKLRILAAIKMDGIEILLK